MDLDTSLQQAVDAGHLLAASQENIHSLLQRSSDVVYREAIEELVEAQNWEELNDRFFQTLAFGTGGLRGRTIGRTVTKAEQGEGGPQGRPEFPCVGTNAMNTFSVSRATQGLIAYVKQWRESEGLEGKPMLVFSHDTRHFSRDFAEMCARIATELGCDAALWDTHRPTPQLSYAIRQLGADAGVMLTASHNPAHDNGYKASFNDGAQLTPPHDKNVIEMVASIPSEDYQALAADEQGSLTMIGDEDLGGDRAYRQALEETILDASVFEGQELPGIVFTPLHGCGARHTIAPLEKLGFPVFPVPSQMEEDARFPTVESANPENASALQLGLELAEEKAAAVVIATDPDCDRMGIAVRDDLGTLTLLTGNQVGILLAYYRLHALQQQGILTAENASNTALVKTFVTSYMADAIAQHFGVQVVNTLTGFKWIAAKMKKWADAVPEGEVEDYQQAPTQKTRAARLQHSRYMVLGFEESYGYLSVDKWRDKDGNEAVLMLAEVLAWAAKQNKTLPEVLDDLYARFGYFMEQNQSIYFEGASGAAKIKSLQASYQSNPPQTLGGSEVVKVEDFSVQPPVDEEGEQIAKTSMLLFSLADGRKVAVRPSGTEPKIKFYLFGQQLPQDSFNKMELASAKTQVQNAISSLWDELEADARQRAEG